jgi:putative transcriptional regulator
MSTGYSQNKPFQRERQKLGKKITTLRKSKGMTQEKLAEKAKINVSYLAKIESGYVNTTIRYLIIISRGLGVSVKDLVDF